MGRQNLTREQILDAYAMLDVFWLLLTTVRAMVRPRHDLVIENLLLRHQLSVLTRPTRSRPRARFRPWDKLAVDSGSPILRRLARTSVLRHTRDGGALAPPGLASILALEFSLPRRATSSQSRSQRTHHNHLTRESVVGHRTGP